MRRPSVLLASLALLLASPATAQLVVESLEARHPNGTLYHFPHIGGDSPAAARINTFLQARELERIPGQEGEGPFEALWPQEGSENGLVQMDYALHVLQPGILRVDIRGEHYGAYLSGYAHSYHFDASTGRPIRLSDLLTPEGLAKLEAEVTARRLQKLDDFLAGKPVGHAVLRSDAEEAAEQKQLYAECRESVAMASPGSDALRLEPWHYELVREPCAPHALRALDEVDLSTSRSYERDQAWLSDYGRCLLVERRARCSRPAAGFAPGVYLGTIGDRYPITLVLEWVSSDGRARAWYFYDAHRKAIALDAARAADGSWTFAENGARFALRATEEGLAGQWTREAEPPLEVRLH